ncbi:type II secretion system F family protein [Pararhodobacter sp.]|uniref:type II secretion system F family protein n=1 Tax=Pararhodobacter sp. TaxID=2127056 RepID=UPI002FDE41EF
MKTFAYTAFTPDGKRRRGVVVAEDEADASAKVSAQGLLPSEISSQTAARPTRARARFIDHDMLSVFTRQMAVLLSAGMAADAALEAVQTAAGASRIERLAAEARAGLMEGEPLSQALERAGGALPAWFTAAIRAGEHSGDLDAVFLTLADHLESTASDRAAITSALIYPAFVAGVAVIVCAVLMVTVAPEIVAMFAATGQELPPLTLAVLGMVDFIQDYWPWLAALLAGLVALGVASNRVTALKNRRDRLVLRLPLAGRFLRMAEAAAYLRTLALVINSRLPLTEALRFAADVLGTEGFTLEARAAGEALRRGENLSSALSRLSFLHPVARQLIQAGEASARLGPMSDRAAVLAESWLRTERKRVAVVLEPAAMVVVGAMVLVIVLAVLLPIFDMQAMVGS